ncbi:MAG: segregation/condensation protein A [Patescibacteria group bacterium]|jgi:segregation and condensation protein A|nr:segregation/condensation protein A [Patescibacteria group bacterium]
MYKVELEKFAGPLDLLLQLIENEKLDVCELSLSKITDTYLTELKKMDKSSEELAEFVVIAAKLLYVKSKGLLPSIETAEEEQEIADLEAALLEYQKYKEAAKTFEQILEKNMRSYSRQAVPEKVILFSPPKDVNRQKLFEILAKLLAKNEIKPEEEIIKPVKFSLEEKKGEISRMIHKGKVSFTSLFKRSTTKAEIIVTFLAILEMVKQKEIVVSQNKNFADFSLSRVK